MPINLTIDQSVTVLSLERSRGNAIGPAFIESMHAALNEVERSPAQAVVVTGHGRAFCGGLDLVTIFDFNRAELSAFVDAFEAMFLRVFTFPKPVVAAINGHAIAGGGILALAADRRIMAPGALQFALNEVALGIPFPSAAFGIARHSVPPAAVTQVFLEGRRFSTDEALALGLIDRIAGERGVLADAIEEARRLTAGAPDAIADVKAELRAPAVASIRAKADASRERFLDRWFAAEARKRIGAIHADLVKRHAQQA